MRTAIMILCLALIGCAAQRQAREMAEARAMVAAYGVPESQRALAELMVYNSLETQAQMRIWSPDRKVSTMVDTAYVPRTEWVSGNGRPDRLVTVLPGY